MQKVFAKANDADALIQAAPENQPYRNVLEIRNLFARLVSKSLMWIVVDLVWSEYSIDSKKLLISLESITRRLRKVLHT